MSAKRLAWLLPALFLLLGLLPGAWAAGDMEELLPPVSCGAGWQMEGKPLFYNRDTLSDRIDGEAELYFPYGFERMAAARYAAKKTPEAGIDVEIYRMGSLLDAFGMYANYRQKEGSTIAVGAESNLSPSQLFSYQGRFFIHIQMTGTSDAATTVLAECGRTVAARLPGTQSRPPELSALERSEVVKGTERYLPQSLLGYDFLNRGIMADAVVGGTNLQIFLLLGQTAESASAAFGRYRSLLAQGKIESGGNDAALVEGVDPLYGPVVILRKGGCLAGALKFGAKDGVRALLERICR
ncbi:hypothetical protein F6V25_02730 [Oryzomonas japonica]|uniref:Uncharacterized protein n=1 Tax=Oryzomonas japonica TaxID=2603858 RepID=A0A7J4ZVH7_9BACT|nr:DUF6599 family protein [Oryzomonas japonica]KAB0667626.1 hypothetical protein F6V25_02730 [Oryzomonas japonica]